MLLPIVDASVNRPMLVVSRHSTPVHGPRRCLPTRAGVATRGLGSLRPLPLWIGQAEWEETSQDASSRTLRVSSPLGLAPFVIKPAADETLSTPSSHGHSECTPSPSMISMICLGGGANCRDGVPNCASHQAAPPQAGCPEHWVRHPRAATARQQQGPAEDALAASTVDAMKSSTQASFSTKHLQVKHSQVTQARLRTTSSNTNLAPIPLFSHSFLS